MFTSTVTSGVRTVERTTLERMDENAFRSLYQNTAPMLRSYIRRACGDPALADDILQETFFHFLRANLAPLEPNQAKAYLYRTAMSRLADHWRRSRRESRWSWFSMFRDEGTPAPDSGGDVMHIFGKLKLQEQTLLWLAYVEGFDHKEIADALKIREKSVRVLLFRARRKMADILVDQGLGPERAL